MLLVGTSGWYYYNWKNLFYPNHLKPAEWLSYYSKHFNTIELNNSFYSLPSENTVKKWYNNTPENFIFSIKAWKLITHEKRLLDCNNEIIVFINSIAPLKHKLGPILFQTPNSFKKDLVKLEKFLKILPKDYKYSFEFRNISWHSSDVYNILHQYNIAFCIFDLAIRISPICSTTDFIYIRLHGVKELYKGKYSNETLTFWKNWIIKENKSGYCYFNNTMLKNYAIENATTLIDLQHK